MWVPLSLSYVTEKREPDCGLHSLELQRPRRESCKSLSRPRQEEMGKSISSTYSLSPCPTRCTSLTSASLFHPFPPCISLLLTVYCESQIRTGQHDRTVWRQCHQQHPHWLEQHEWDKADGRNELQHYIWLIILVVFLEQYHDEHQERCCVKRCGDGFRIPRSGPCGCCCAGALKKGMEWTFGSFG